MKAYTDMEQSKKLAEILPIGTADMWYQYIGESFKDGITKPLYFPMVIRNDPSEKDIPCWSLAALLNVLNCSNLEKERDRWYCNAIIRGITVMRGGEDSAVDTCVNAIIKLKEDDLI